jgi:hypothetical protein
MHSMPDPSNPLLKFQGRSHRLRVGGNLSPFVACALSRAKSEPVIATPAAAVQDQEAEAEKKADTEATSETEKGDTIVSDTIRETEEK